MAEFTEYVSKAYFNSIKVQLEQTFQYQHHNPNNNFNSIKVQLEHNGHYKSCDKPINFNSIKVQLEQQAGLNPNLMMKFQFHKGTIRTSVPRARRNSGYISIP